MSLHIDPYSITENKNIGYYANGDFNKIKIYLEQINNNDSNINDFAKEYVKTHHEMNNIKVLAVSKTFEKILLSR